MKIKEVTEDEIVFDNGMSISFEFFQECWEHNYADFKQIEPLAMEYDFDEELIFKKSKNGFRFGDKKQMFYIPCYSEQNGFYSEFVDIFFNGKRVLSNCNSEIIDGYGDLDD